MTGGTDRRAAVPPHVLVVDDDGAVLGLLAEALRQEGYRVTALGGAPAPATVADLAPDALVLDLRFGNDGGVGAALLAALRAQPATAALPVVVCTADRAQAEALAPRLPELGARLLPKPFDLGELLGVVADALRSGGWEQAAS